MRLQRLTGLEREKIVDEFKEVMALIASLREILGTRLVLEIIVKELREIRSSSATSGAPRSWPSTDITSRT